MWVRMIEVYRSVVLGLSCTCLSSQVGPYTATVVRPAAGSTYWPVTTAAVTSSSHCCASTFREKCRACSRCAPSRYRARHLPSGLFVTLAIKLPSLSGAWPGLVERTFTGRVTAAFLEPAQVLGQVSAAYSSNSLIK